MFSSHRSVLTRFQSRVSQYAKFNRSNSRCLSSQNESLPSEADIVVVGGGIIGTSVAYHLAKLSEGSRNVLLLERDQLTSGTTWHAAGLMVTYGGFSETSTEMRKYTKELYSHILEEETGLSTGFKPCGFIELATNKDRLEEFRRVAAFNRYCGVNVQEISPNEVKHKFPLCKIDDVEAGFYVEDDGRVNPVDATMALAKAARQYGAKIIENVSVSKILKEKIPGTGNSREQVKGIELANGQVIKANTVVNCGGMWARQLSETAGVVCPNQAAEHYYLVTDNMPDVDPDWPVIEDPASYTYIRPEGEGLMVGLFEAKAAAWNVNKIPSDFSFGEIGPDWDRMTPYLEQAMARVPSSMEVGMKTFFCGPESFTPDLGPILGETPEVDQLFIAAGMNSIGILTGGGAGRLVARWVLNGYPDQDVSGVEPARFQKYQQSPLYRQQRVEEMLGKVYKCHYPNDLPMSGRGAKQSPIYDHLKKKGAFFRDVSGYESADWFAPGETDGARYNPPTWDKPVWFDFWAEEHKACREGVVLMDMSFMSKFHITGKGTGAMLDWLSTAAVDHNVDDGRITYTQWLNAQGTVEADLTVTKVSHDDFMVIASDTAHRHVLAHMQRHSPPTVQIQDVTTAYAQLNIQGPHSRALLKELSDIPMDGDSFAFRDAKSINIGLAQVMCVRITYLGELGYELYIPVEQVHHVYNRICEAGEKHSLRHAGLKALASLRLEKGYRDYGHDVDNTDPILRTGLSFTCDFEKPNGFLGKEATLEHRSQLTQGKHRGPMALDLRLANVFCNDPSAMLYHGEVLFRDGEPAGYVRAASYGHTLGGAVGIAEVGRGTGDGSGPVISAKYLREGSWEVEVAGHRYPCQVQLKPFYDSKNERIAM